MKKLKIALTMGDPAGIGPEQVVQVAKDPEFSGVELVVYGSRGVIAEAAGRYAGGVMPQMKEIGELKFSDFVVCTESALCGVAARDAVVAATQDAIDGNVDAIVTAPMNKASVNLAGIDFTGHTELIAEMCGVDNYAMMQSDGSLRVAFVTTHIPLADVTRFATKERIVEVGHLLNDVAKAEGVERPRIAVAGINPHAGENGYMGIEDEQVVKPAMALLGEQGVDVDGPFPSDTLFIESIRTQYDGILAMYHDQGHIPFKMLAFDRGVNSTLGLPIIRTSVDHGTAFNIAWQGKADLGSLKAALRTAVVRAEK